jgi:hypothetical protein
MLSEKLDRPRGNATVALHTFIVRRAGRSVRTMPKEARSAISDHTKEYSSINTTVLNDSDVWYNAHSRGTFYRKG